MYNPLLDTFICVCDCGSFNSAAKKLFVSAPSVMKQINALENHLNLILLIRTSHGIQITRAGQIIYKQAKEMIRLSKQTILEAKKAEAIMDMTLNIGSSLLNPCKPFMDFWYSISKDFPGYKLNIVPFDDKHQDILNEIEGLGTKFDFIIGVNDSKLWQNRCQFLKLGTYQHQIAMSREHPLANKKSLSLQDLYGQTIMMVKKGDSKAVDEIRKKIEKHPQIQIEDTSQFYDMKVFNRCATTNNLMITIECWKDVHPGLVTLPMDWNFPIPYGILYPQTPTESVKKIIDKIAQLNQPFDESVLH